MNTPQKKIDNNTVLLTGMETISTFIDKNFENPKFKDILRGHALHFNNYSNLKTNSRLTSEQKDTLAKMLLEEEIMSTQCVDLVQALDDMATGLDIESQQALFHPLFDYLGRKVLVKFVKDSEQKRFPSSVELLETTNLDVIRTWVKYEKYQPTPDNINMVLAQFLAQAWEKYIKSTNSTNIKQDSFNRLLVMGITNHYRQEVLNKGRVTPTR